MGNEQNPIKGAEFERKCLAFFAEAGIELQRPFLVPVGVNEYKKGHKFDLGSEECKVIVECKCHTWTSGNNAPSAKMSTWNEAMYYFYICPPGYRKIFCVLKSEKDGQTLSEYYIRRHREFIPGDVEIWEYDIIFGKAKVVFNSKHNPNTLANDKNELQTNESKPIERGQINRNDQRNLGRSEPFHKGTDHRQYVYIIQCTKCGHIYGANGSDVFQRKCPKCQDGRPGVQLNI